MATPGPDAERASEDAAYRVSGEFLQDVAESRLIEIGGQALLDRAQYAAGLTVDALYPWDGLGAEPEARVSEYISVLWRFTENGT